MNDETMVEGNKYDSKQKKCDNSDSWQHQCGVSARRLAISLPIPEKTIPQSIEWYL